MKARLKNVGLLVAVVVFMPITWVALFTGPDLSSEELMEKRLAELRDRLTFAETLNKERENDIHSLRSQLNYLLKSSNRTGTMGQAGFPMQVREMLHNMSYTGGIDIKPPTIYHYLPHLVGKPEGLRPAYAMTQGRMGVSIVMGIPTIKREKESYLSETLRSLIDGLNDEEKDDCLIVVFVGEPFDMAYAEQQAKIIKGQFSASVESGLLEVISPPSIYYPNLNNLRETFGDSKERVKWRTKQNLDFSFLMMYARTRGTYYVQLEDDVVAKPGYMSTMKNFALNQKTEDWMLLEFSYLGFIGKLFKSSDLAMVVEFFLMFHKDKPIDWLLDHLLFVKVCNPEKDAKHCRRSIAELRRRFKPSLFQHIGTHSSLKGKIQKLKDKDFGKAALHRAHSNPSAEVASTVKIYQQYTIQRAYLGETFFWGLIPKAGDTVSFKFNPPILMEHYFFKSGNSEHPGDKFYNTTVEILPEEHTKKQSGVLDNKAHEDEYPMTDDGFLVVGNFSHVTGVATGNIKETVKEINTLRLRVHYLGEAWCILSEILIKPRTKKR